MRKGNIINHLTNAAIFIILEIAALNMLRNNAELQNSWFAKGGHAFMGTVWGISHDISDYFSLRKRNEALALENHGLMVRITELENFIADSIRISRLPVDGVADGYRYIPATIEKISRNTQHNYIIIGKGSNDGIVNGAGVITGKGVIGVIDGVSENFAYARSFQNHDMSISARLGKNGAAGPMSWDGINSNGAIMREIPHHIKFEVGDTVYTSGYSSKFPPDIPLGVTRDSKIVNGATFEIGITLFEDFGALRHVTIVEKIGIEEINKLENGQ